MQLNEAHFKSDVVYSKANQYIDSVDSDWMFADAHYTDPGYLLSRKRVGLDSSGLSHFNLSQSAQDSTINEALTSIEMSFDQVYRITFGLAMIKKMIPNNLTYNGQSFQDGETGIQEEAMNILDRVMDQSKSMNYPPGFLLSKQGPWVIFNPITEHTVQKGAVSAYCWALAESGNSMNLGFYDVSPSYYLPGGGPPYGGPYYHTTASILLMYSVWHASHLSFSIGNENDNRHMYSILAAMIGVSNNYYPFRWAYTGGVDHEPFYAEHTPLVRSVLHGGNANYYSDGHYINLLNSAPCIGPYKWNWNPDGQNPNGLQHDAASLDWSTQDRLGHPERRGYGYTHPGNYNYEKHKDYAPSRAGEYAGVDYMLYHNLYYTIHHSDYLNPTNLMDNYVTYPFPHHFGPMLIGTAVQPVEIDMFNTITATNIIRGDATNYLTNNESGKVIYRAGQEIYLQPGFQAEVGSDFYAYVKKFECATDGSYHANSTIASENTGRDSLYGMNTMNFNFHNEEQRVAYNYYYYDDRDPGKSGYGIVKEYDLPVTDTSDFAAYLSNFADVTPNPTKGVTRISLPEDFFGQGNFTVSIFNLTGELLYEKEFQETNQFELDFSPFSKGMYIVNVLLGESQIKLTKKVIKE